VGLTFGLALLAEALGKESRAEEALNLLAEALAVASRNGNQMYEAEIYRLRGELLLASSRAENRTESESCFRFVVSRSALALVFAGAMSR
jgi:hypothetical protein